MIGVRPLVATRGVDTSGNTNSGSAPKWRMQLFGGGKSMQRSSSGNLTLHSDSTSRATAIDTASTSAASNSNLSVNPLRARSAGSTASSTMTNANTAVLNSSPNVSIDPSSADVGGSLSGWSQSDNHGTQCGFQCT